MHYSLSKLDELGPVWPESLLSSIREENRKRARTIVVLDDDPTGTQTLYDIPVLTSWDPGALKFEFKSGTPLFFILTNSRAFPANEAVQLTEDIGNNLLEASRETGRPFSVISRSDSTLRGHYPAEVEALGRILGLKDAAHLIIPAFFEGGRYTFCDTHYVKEGDELVPAHETPFAKDPAFGFSTAVLPEWVEEKTQGRISKNAVVSISIDDLRLKGPEEVTRKLILNNAHAVVVNAVCYRDLEVFTLGLIRAEKEGKQFIPRTAASFVPVRHGIQAGRKVLPESIKTEGKGGLIVVGSYIPKTSQQLDHLIQNTDVFPFEIDVAAILRGEGEKVVQEATHYLNQHLASGHDVVIYTSRNLIHENSGEENLSVGQKISGTLVAIVDKLKTQPQYLLAKGGITSSDIATRALGIKRGWVLGQARPGVPVWQTEKGSKFENMKYIVFPGNVGDKGSITEIILSLRET